MSTRPAPCSMRLATALVRSIAFALLAFAARPLRAQVDATLMARIAWTDGPAVGQLADIAQVDVPEICRFTDAEGVKQFLAATHEVWSGRELGVLLCRVAPNDDDAWFVLFTYNAIGLVRDDEKTSLDARKLLAGLRRTNDSINDLRRRQGGVGADIVGWGQRPVYDSVLHSLSWSTRLRDQTPDASEGVSHAIRMLGRNGDMNIDFAVEAANDDAVSELSEKILRGFTFLPGQRYADWHAGDPVSTHGLSMLIVGWSGRSSAAGVVVMMGAGVVVGFLIWLLWTMSKERRQGPLKAGAA